VGRLPAPLTTRSLRVLGRCKQREVESRRLAGRFGPEFGKPGGSLVSTLEFSRCAVLISLCRGGGHPRGRGVVELWPGCPDRPGGRSFAVGRLDVGPAAAFGFRSRGRPGMERTPFASGGSRRLGGRDSFRLSGGYLRHRKVGCRVAVVCGLAACAGVAVGRGGAGGSGLGGGGLVRHRWTSSSPLGWDFGFWFQRCHASNSAKDRTWFRANNRPTIR